MTNKFDLLETEKTYELVPVNKYDTGAEPHSDRGSAQVTYSADGTYRH